MISTLSLPGPDPVDPGWTMRGQFQSQVTLRGAESFMSQLSSSLTQQWGSGAFRSPVMA